MGGWPSLSLSLSEQASPSLMSSQLRFRGHDVCLYVANVVGAREILRRR